MMDDLADERLARLEGILGGLMADRALGNILTGTLKTAESSMTIRRGGQTYVAGTTNQLASGAGAVLLSANKMYAVPFYAPGIPNRASIIGLQVTTGAIGYIRLGIYNSKKTYPFRLLLDAGTVATDTAGVKSISIGQSLPRGLIWLVLLSSAAPAIKMLQGGLWAPLGALSSDPTSGYTCYDATYTYGPLPLVFPATASIVGAYTPYLFLQMQ